MEKIKKNKTILIATCISVVVIGLLIFFIGHISTSKVQEKNFSESSSVDKSNQNGQDSKNKNDSGQQKITIVSSEVVSVAVKSDNKLYALMNNGNTIEIIDMTNYYDNFVYTYDNNRLYLYLTRTLSNSTNSKSENEVQNSMHQNVLGYVDFSDNSFKELTSTDTDDFPSSITVLDNKIYYTTSSNKIYVYDLNTRKSTLSNRFTFNENEQVKLYNASNGTIVYAFDSDLDEPPSVGIIDSKTNEKKILSSKARFQYIYGNKIIYKEYENSPDYTYWKYYEYDVSNSNLKQISDITTSVTDPVISFIIPIDDYYIYVNMNSLYKFSNNIGEKIYEFPGVISSMNLISDDTLAISYSIDNTIKDGTFDLKSLKFVETNDINSYSSILYIQ